MAEFLHFSIQGEFITNTARELFYCEHKLDKAIKIIKGATMNDELSEIEHLTLCLEIIAGTKNIVGTYPGDDYGIEDNPNGSFDDFINEIENYGEKYRTVQQELTDTLRKFAFVCEDLTDYRLQTLNREYYEQYGEFLFETSDSERRFMEVVMGYSDVRSAALDSYLERRKDENEHQYEDYGWLEPDGTYHAVDWAHHAEWAKDYLDEHYPFKENPEIYWKTDNDGTRHHYVNGDVLVYCLGWVLLDSPGQGLAYPTYNHEKGLTKAQKEFLFDYYTERNRNKEASALYADDDY